MRRYDLPPMMGSIIDKKATEQREKEAKEAHRAELPDFANNMWKSYIDIINLDYTEGYLKMTRFDCPVCFDTFPETDAIFCTSLDPEIEDHDRHQFCKNCLHGHAIAASTQMLFGKGGAGVTCLEHGCKGVILQARVTPVLNADEKKQFEERILNIALQESGLKNLVKCQRCFYAVVNDQPKEVDSIFECENEKCGFHYCRLCERPYDEKHKDKTCDQVMTICIRICAKCQNEFTRDGGCSKMTCNRCGTTQCYLCKQSGVDYSHFSDNGCPLWMNDQQVAARDEQERQNIIASAKDDALLEADRQGLK
ncbi:unnamed protein product, partial [Mesorhabditis belari]|uniref:RING-type domain-containing protein n=1 Tax=Mesorhabditis belari TaxID=2138241 RepID=A0AAF3EEZ4_9BILA